ncbi:unnamed protein product [Prorocentrum cordatum]|uniref:Uncharacterized protein n=1 Tax=Prorocentrum cordatum TaxID=2364126 RepID=A0ABN9SRR4_9DINO|nr:unnamed protein product [Polarella glacialis]
MTSKLDYLKKYLAAPGQGAPAAASKEARKDKPKKAKKSAATQDLRIRDLSEVLPAAREEGHNVKKKTVLAHGRRLCVDEDTVFVDKDVVDLAERTRVDDTEKSGIAWRIQQHRRPVGTRQAPKTEAKQEVKEEVKQEHDKGAESDISPPRAPARASASASARPAAEDEGDGSDLSPPRRGGGGARAVPAAPAAGGGAAAKKGTTAAKSAAAPRRQRHDSDSDLSPPRRAPAAEAAAAGLEPGAGGAQGRSPAPEAAVKRQRHDSDSDLSPPRKAAAGGPAAKAEVKRQRHDSDSDLSPPRKAAAGGPAAKAEVKRQRHDSDSDLSPPRKAAVGGPAAGVEAHRKRHDSDSDLSPPRKATGSSAMAAAESKKARHDSDSDLSPPRGGAMAEEEKMSSGLKIGLVKGSDLKDGVAAGVRRMRTGFSGKEAVRAALAQCVLGAGRGRGRRQEGDDEQLEAEVQLLLRWLEASGAAPRVTAHILGDQDFVCQAVRDLCPGTHAEHARALGGEAPAADVAAACLGAALGAVRAVEVDAAGMVARAVRAGGNDLEPLADIVRLWRHVLLYAVCCESRERHVLAIQGMPQDVQQQLMEIITGVEQRLGSPRRSRGETPPAARAGRASLLSCSGRAEPPSPERGGPRPRTSLVPPGEEKEAIEALLRENEWLRAANRKLGGQAEKQRSALQQSSEAIDGEIESFYHSWHLERQLREKEEQVQLLRQEIDSGRGVVEEAKQLQDELVLARSREAEHKATQQRLEWCNRRLEEAGSVKQELTSCLDAKEELSQENSALKMQVTQLKQAGQRLETFKGRVRDLELMNKDCQTQLREAEARAGCAESERLRLAGDKALLEEQLLQTQMDLNALKEGVPGSLESGGVVEPFTQELRDRMQALESQNACLQEQLTQEGSQRVAELTVDAECARSLRDHYEQEFQGASAQLRDERQRAEALLVEGAELREQLRAAEWRAEEEERRADAAEEALAASGEQCAAREEEALLLRSQCAALEAELREARGALEALRGREGDLEEELRQAGEDLAHCRGVLERDAAALGAARARARELEAEADALRARALQAEEAAEEAREDLEMQSGQLEELRRQREQLEGWQGQALELRVERDALAARAEEAEAEAARQASELERCRRDFREGLEQAAELEARALAGDCERRDLRQQLAQSGCERALAQRSHAGLVEREEAWAQKQCDLVSRLEDLRDGLGAEEKLSRSLGEQLSAAEGWSSRLEELLRRASPAELERLRREHAAAVGAPLSAAPPEHEAAQLRAEARRLREALREQRLRGAEEAVRLAQLTARLRQFERAAESGQMGALPAPAPAGARERPPALTDAGAALCASARPPAPRAAAAPASPRRAAAREPAAEPTGHVPARACGRAAGAGAAPAPTPAPAPALAPASAAGGIKMAAKRCSILKKPRMPAEEACVVEGPASGAPPGRTGILGARRGLLGAAAGGGA